MALRCRRVCGRKGRLQFGFVTDADSTGRYLLSNGFLSATARGINEISLLDGKCTYLLPDVSTKSALFAPDGSAFLFATTSPDGSTIHRQGWKDGKLVGSPIAALRLPFSFVVNPPYSAQSFTDYDFTSDLSTVFYARPDSRADLYLMSRVRSN